MEWTVVVFDTNALRSSVMCSALEQCSTPYDIQIHAANSLESLQKIVARENADVLLCDARAIDLEGSGGNAVQELARSRAHTQVVYTGVSEKTLVTIEMNDHAFLLPASSGVEDVSRALNRSIQLRAKELERPIIVTTMRHSRSLAPSRVSYIESDLRKIRIHLSDDIVETYGKLSDVLSRLPRRFVQCHKSFVVNLGFVKEMCSEHLVLTTGERIPVSQKRRKSTREAFVSYVGRAL